MTAPDTPSPAGLLISRDLMFTSKITGTAGALGLRVQVVPDRPSALRQIAFGGIRAVFIDLAETGLDLAALVTSLPAENPPAVIAFGSHVATATLQAARDAGCTEVLPRSRFSAELPELLARYLIARTPTETE